MKSFISTGVAGCLAGLLWAGGALAQGAAPSTASADSGDELQEIVVTAERKEENLQKTPMNVTVVTGQAIAEQGMVNMQDVLNGLPGVSVQGQVRGFVPSIRGLGTDLPPGSSEGSVATEEDGVYDIRAEAGRIGYYDLSRVEVLAGPQGTLYGVNSDGGVVNIISNDPTIGKFQSSGSLTVGNYNLIQGQGMVNLPVSDNSTLRMAIAAVNQDGFLTNTGASDNVGQGGRAKYLWKPSEDFSLLLGLEIAKLGGKGSGSIANYPGGDPTTSNPWVDSSAGTTASDINQWDNYHSTKYWAAAKWNAGPVAVSFTPSYKSDYDIQNSCGMGASCTLQGDPIELEQNSEELRFSNNYTSTLNWSFGGYHWGYLEKEAGMGPGNPPPVTYYQTSNGVFGETTWSFTDVSRLITGVRETWDWKHETDIAGANGNWEHFDYRVGLEYDLTPQSMEYVTVATGYRPGGYNSDATQYKTEVVRDIEAGSKNRFFSDRLQVNADVYYYDFSNYQLLDFYFSGPCSQLSPPPPTYNLQARNIGVDLSLQAAVTSNDTANLSLSYMNAKFTSSQVISYDTPTSCPAGSTGNADVEQYTIDGSPEPRAPKLSGTGSWEHRFPLPNGGQLSASPSVHFSESYYINPVENIYGYQPGYATWDFNLMYRSPDSKWTINAWTRNAGDLAVKSQLNPGMIGPPRTYGVTVTANLN